MTTWLIYRIVLPSFLQFHSTLNSSNSRQELRCLSTKPKYFSCLIFKLVVFVFMFSVDKRFRWIQSRGVTAGIESRWMASYTQRLNVPITKSIWNPTVTSSPIPDGTWWSTTVNRRTTMTTRRYSRTWVSTSPRLRWNRKWSQARRSLWRPGEFQRNTNRQYWSDLK